MLATAKQIQAGPTASAISHHAYTSPANARMHRRSGLTLLELLACVTILSILMIVLLPNVRQGTSTAKSKSCSVNKSVIEVQTAMWNRAHGEYPMAQMSDIAADPDYFPDGLPVCPVEGKPYEINPSTGAVTGHDH